MNFYTIYRRGRLFHVMMRLAVHNNRSLCYSRDNVHIKLLLERTEFGIKLTALSYYVFSRQGIKRDRRNIVPAPVTCA